MTKKRKVIIGSISAGVGIIALAILITLMVLSKQYTPEATVQQFVTAIEKKDAKQLKQIVVSKDKKLKITQDNLKPFMAYYKKNDKALMELQEELLDAIENEEEEITSSVLTLKPAGKAYGIFTKYKMVVESHYINLSVSGEIKEVTMKEGKTEYLAKDKEKQQFGPFLPGTYELLVSYEDPFGIQTEKKEKIEIIQQDKVLTINQKEDSLKNKKFQKQMLTDVLEYFRTYGVAIENQLNIKEVTHITEDYREGLDELFTFIKPYVSHYDYEFKGVIINVDSLSLTQKGGEQWVLKVDMIMDLSTDLSLKVEEETLDVANTEETNSAVLTLVFDADAKEWQVDEEDYSTFKRDPSLWHNKLEYTLKNPIKNSWKGEPSGEEGSTI